MKQSSCRVPSLVDACLNALPMPLIRSMRGTIQRARGYGQDGFELVVSVSFDAKEFNRIKKTSDPLAVAMPQIKNVVLDATGIRGTPGYAAISMHQRFPRAKNGLVTLDLYFDVSAYNATELGADLKQYSVYHKVELNKTLEQTRDEGHLFAKSVLASQVGN